jgi:hypothetical protein
MRESEVRMSLLPSCGVSVIHALRQFSGILTFLEIGKREGRVLQSPAIDKVQDVLGDFLGPSTRSRRRQRAIGLKAADDG